MAYRYRSLFVFTLAYIATLIALTFHEHPSAELSRGAFDRLHHIAIDNLNQR
jgi:hypothetical protein